MDIKIRAVEMSGEKIAGSAILTGALSLLLTGGTFVSISSPVDGHQTEISILDAKTREILWYNSVLHQGFDKNNYTLDK